MSEARKTLLELLERDPELRPIAPFLKALLEAPSDTQGCLVSLAEFWSSLKGERRAVLVLSVRQDLTVKKIAQLVGVHHRTLYKSKAFKRARSRVRQDSADSQPHGWKEDDELEAYYDPFE